MLRFFVSVVFFFTGTRSKTQKLRMRRSRQSNFLQNDVSFSHTRSKIVGEDELLVGKVQLFKEREKQCNTILTMYKIST